MFAEYDDLSRLVRQHGPQALQLRVDRYTTCGGGDVTRATAVLGRDVFSFRQRVERVSQGDGGRTKTLAEANEFQLQNAFSSAPTSAYGVLLFLLLTWLNETLTVQIA